MDERELVTAFGQTALRPGEPTEARAAAVRGGREGAARREQLAEEHDDTRTWVTPGGYRLSDRVWKAGQLEREGIERVLQEGIAAGRSADQIAKDLAAHALDPTSRYPMRRLARTELTRAFGKGTVDAALANPLVTKIAWRLSASHPKTDQCDSRQAGSPYDKTKLPRYPDHPQCLCSLVPVVDEDIDDIVARLREEIGPPPEGPTGPRTRPPSDRELDRQLTPEDRSRFVLADQFDPDEAQRLFESWKEDPRYQVPQDGLPPSPRTDFPYLAAAESVQALPAEDRETIGKHVDQAAYYPLSSSLRGGSTDPSVLAEAAIFDRSFDKLARLETSQVLFRGVPNGLDIDALSGLRPGDTFVDRGFPSTSLDPNEALGYAVSAGRAKPDRGVLFRITVPEGTPVFWARGMGEDPALNARRYEDGTASDLGGEVVLPRDLVFRVTRSEKPYTRGPQIVDVEATYVPGVEEPLTRQEREDLANKRLKKAVDDASVMRQFDDWRRSLSPDQDRAIGLYVVSRHRPINESLRAGEEPYTALDAQAVQGLDASLASAPALDREILVYRGRAGLIDHAVGESFQDLGFVSTSLSRGFAESWAEAENADETTLYRIQVPPGTPIGYLDMVTIGEAPSPFSTAFDARKQNEILLPRGSVFRVTRVQDSTGRRVVDLELVRDRAFAAPPYSARELQALLDYKNDSSINDALRGPYQDDYEDDDVDVEYVETGGYLEEEAIINRVIARSPIPEKITVYRGLFQAPKDLYELKPGTTFVDFGFVSTSSSLTVARDQFGRGDDVDGLLFEIELPVSTPAADLSNVGQLFGGEGELLLASQSRFQVLSSEKRDGQMRTIRLRWLDSPMVSTRAFAAVDRALLESLDIDVAVVEEQLETGELDESGLRQWIEEAQAKSAEMAAVAPLHEEAKSLGADVTDIKSPRVALMVVDALRQVKSVDDIQSDAYPEELVFRLGRPEDFDVNGGYAFYETGYSGLGAITVNPDPDAFDATEWARLADDGWFSSPDQDATFIHEIGHRRHDETVGSRRFNEMIDEPLDSAQQVVARKVSEYATTSPVEFVAETYVLKVKGVPLDPDVEALYRELGGPELKRSTAAVADDAIEPSERAFAAPPMTGDWFVKTLESQSPAMLTTFVGLAGVDITLGKLKTSDPKQAVSEAFDRVMKGEPNDSETDKIIKIFYEAGQLESLLNYVPPAAAEYKAQTVDERGMPLRDRREAVPQPTPKKAPTEAERLDTIALEELLVASREAARSLDPKTRSVVESYAKSLFGELNGALRGTNDPPENQDANVAAMDSLIDDSPRLSDPIVVYRGERRPHETIELGRTFTDPAFVSTSYSEAYVREKFTAPGGVLYKIVVPKGVRVAAMDQFNVDAFVAENEILLGRGTTFKIVGDETVNNVREVSLEVVLDEPRRAFSAPPPDAAAAEAEFRRLDEGIRDGTIEITVETLRRADELSKMFDIEAAFPSSAPAPPSIVQELDDQMYGLIYGFDKLPNNVRNALEYYKRDGYTPINEHLRSGPKDSDAERRVELIDEAWDRAPRLQNDTTVYRAVRYAGVEAVKDLKVGDVFRDPAFVSTSLDREYVKEFGGDYATFFEIRVPKGEKFLYLDTIISMLGEQEVLLNRDTVFRVVGDETVNNVRRMKLEIVKEKP